MQRDSGAGRRRGLPSRCELTLAGKVTLTFLAITFCIALLHGSNPVLFIVSCLTATIVLSMALTFVSTGRLSVKRSLPERVFLGAPFDVRLLVKNRSRWRPALGLGFLDAFQISRPGELTCGPTLPVLPPGRVAEISYTKRIHRRGVYKVVNFVAASRFPFALFERRVVLRTEPTQLVVLPALGRLRRAGRKDLVARLAQPRESRSSADGREEFHGLQDYRYGDSLRMVHWKTSARVGKLMRRVMQDESGEDLHILLDTRVAGFDAEIRERNLERAISCAATLLTEAARRGRRATVHFHGGCAKHHGVLQGVLPALEVLAGIESGAEGLEEVVSGLRVRRSARVLVLSLLGPATRARRAAQRRGIALHVWDVGHAEFGRLFTKR